MKLPHFRFLPQIQRESGQNTLRSTISGSSQFQHCSHHPTHGQATPPPDEKYKTLYLRRHSSSSPSQAGLTRQASIQNWRNEAPEQIRKRLIQRPELLESMKLIDFSLKMHVLDDIIEAISQTKIHRGSQHSQQTSSPSPRIKQIHRAMTPHNYKMNFKPGAKRKQDNQMLDQIVKSCQSMLKKNRKQNKKMNKSASSLVLQHNKLISQVKKYQRKLQQEPVDLSP